MRLLMVATAILVFPPSPTSAQLCTSLPDSSHRFSIHEDDLTAEGAARGVQYLRERIPALLQSAKTAEDVRHSEVYNIGYNNSVMRVQGYVLKLEALLAQAELRAAERDLLARAVAEEAVSERRRRFQVAQRSFCEFLASHHWVD